MSTQARSHKALSLQIWLPIVFLMGVIAGALEILGFNSLLNNGNTMSKEHYGTVFLLLGAGTSVFVLYQLYNLKRNLFAPLGEIMRHLQEILGGNLKSRASVSTRNEFLALAEGVNALAEKLEAHPSQNIEKMQEIINDLNSSTKLLIQRDLELTRANEKLRELDKMKSEFVSLATHQLRTPLSGVRWSLSMLLNGEIGELTPEQKLYVMKTYESNNRMITLINDMLQADRMESGTLKFKFTQTNLMPLFENVLIELAALADKRKIKVNMKADENIPPLTIDPEHMRIVIQNLVDNAIKYSRENSSVDIEVTKADSTVSIKVQDHGIGIPEANQKNIFKRFFRAPNAVHTETDGTGLGLYIVESIIQKHRGTIRFESKENEGTTFYVTLPITADKNE